MKISQLLCCIALVLGYLFIQVHSQATFDIKGKVIPTNKFCKRRIDISKDDSAKTVKFSTTSLCAADRKNGTAIGAFSSMDYVASIVRFPIIGMKAKTTVKVVTPITKVERDLSIVVGSAFGIDRIIEYQEVNGLEGYQPGNDTIVKLYNLREQNWKVLDLSKKLVEGTNDTFIYQALVEANVTGCCTVRMSAVISSAPIQFTSPKVAARTGVTQILSPSSLKVTFELLNIQYSQSSGSYIALGTVVAFRGSRRDKVSTDNDAFAPSSGNSRQSTNYEKPDDASDDQAVTQFDNDLSTQLDGNQASLPKPFFSFQKFISKYSSSSPTVVTRGKLIYTPMNTIEVLNSDEQFIKDSIETSGTVVARFWVSLTERVENAVWDPSSGSQENADYLTTSGANSQSLISFLVVLLSFIICNLL
ncbi:predicted protein [Naegleria gruberi]|uniref:Predicted protein n=1 Tax=Naegleria gruberi TaxID=5762 RepID=D2VHD8_NAEGR|nr:uncharacterized protein NAEGRDRAFT_49477 [Naegleria gruberi]EFC43783.1 predicted protein [Naegleria gruberi]|eukprot:XP_002676527.1 predicted protein [Naegleria gruberi strain NEG-M]